MMGEREYIEPMFYYITIEKLVPKEHFLRLVDSNIDFSFIRPMVKHLYSHTGKPSLDPEVLIKMLLIGYLYNIPSERRLEQEITVNLSYRWFLGYRLDEPMPDHSTISQNRRRRFQEDDTFQKIFDAIVTQCIQKGMVLGKYLATDSTHIKANASMKSLEPIMTENPPSHYLKLIEQNCEIQEAGHEAAQPTPAANEQNTSFNNEAPPTQENKISNDTHISTTDPDARIMTRPNKPKGLHYLDHITIDSLNKVITDVHVTPGNANDHEPYIERIKRQSEQFGFDIAAVASDKAYGYAEIYHELNQMEIDPYIPRQSYPENKALYPRKSFTYDPQKDCYICPNGNQLNKRGYSKERNATIYQSKSKICSQCPDRTRCTTSKRWVKTIYRHIYHADVEKALSNLKTPKAKEMAIFRKSVERIIAEAKGFHGLARAKLRRLSNVKEQCLMTATVQNIKRIVVWSKKKKGPANIQINVKAYSETAHEKLKCCYLKLCKYCLTPV